jgi:hypothetical protein
MVDMSGMHMVGPYLSTNKSKVKGKKSANTAAAREAKAKHDKWLKERGLHPEQRDLARALKGKRVIELPDLKVQENVPLSNCIDGNGVVRGILANLHKEKPEVQREILDKAKRTAPAYSKGGYQYITPGADLTDIGKKK